MNVDWPPEPHHPTARRERSTSGALSRTDRAGPHMSCSHPRRANTPRECGGPPPATAGSPRAGRRSVLGRYLEGESESDRGMPTLGDHTATLSFNLSHFGALALIAVTEGREVGVDIEEIDSGRDAIALAERGLDPAAPAETQATAFHEAWARQEAVVKCLDSGLGAPLRIARRLSALEPGPATPPRSPSPGAMHCSAGASPSARPERARTQAASGASSSPP